MTHTSSFDPSTQNKITERVQWTIFIIINQKLDIFKGIGLFLACQCTLQVRDCNNELHVCMHGLSLCFSNISINEHPPFSAH